MSDRCDQEPCWRLGALAGLWLFTAAAPVSAQSVRETLDELAALPYDERLAAQNEALPILATDPEILASCINDVDAEPLVRSLAAWAAAEVGGHGCDSLSARADIERSQDERVAIASALARCGDFDPLRALLEHDVIAVRFKAAVLLGLLGDEQSMDALVDLGSEPESRPYAAYSALSLALLGHESALEASRSLLNDADFRFYVAIALGRAGDSSVQFDLRFATESDDPMIRHAAMRVLVEGEYPGACAAGQNDPSPRVALDFEAMCGLGDE